MTGLSCGSSSVLLVSTTDAADECASAFAEPMAVARSAASEIAAPRCAVAVGVKAIFAVSGASTVDAAFAATLASIAFGSIAGVPIAMAVAMETGADASSASSSQGARRLAALTCDVADS